MRVYSVFEHNATAYRVMEYEQALMFRAKDRPQDLQAWIDMLEGRTQAAALNTEAHAAQADTLPMPDRSGATRSTNTNAWEHAQHQARIDELQSKTWEANANGDFLDPPGQGAVHYYQVILRLDPGNQDAEDNIAKTDAEALVLEQLRPELAKALSSGSAQEP